MQMHRRVSFHISEICLNNKIKKKYFKKTPSVKFSLKVFFFDKEIHIRFLVIKISNYIYLFIFETNIIGNVLPSYPKTDFEKDSIKIDEIINQTQSKPLFYPLEYSLDRYQCVRATEQGRKFLLNGNKLFQWNIHESLDDFYENEILRLYDGEKLVGMGRYYVNEEGNYIKPTKLL